MANDELYEFTFEDVQDGNETDEDVILDDDELADLAAEAQLHQRATTTQTLAHLLRVGALQDDDDDDEDDEDEDEVDFLSRRPVSSPPSWLQPHEQPQDEGVELLMSGDYGRLAPKIKSRRQGRRNVSRMLEDRRTRLRPLPKEDYAHPLVPNSSGVAVACSDANIYCGQYSADSTFYYTCGQDFRLRVYDTTKALSPYKPNNARHWRGQVMYEQDPGHETRMKVIKTIQGRPGRWTITDSHLSPDNERMIYSSIAPVVYMCSTRDSSPIQKAINFADTSRDDWSSWEDHVAIWSCRFSADGNEVVAGGSGKIFVYDLIADKRTVKIKAHMDDVNSCCWADTASGNVLISASDDTFLKVWDRRSLGSHPKPAGVLVGHTEGITNVAPKGDGRYVISNGKDQALRLWDLRKMCSSVEFDRFPNRNYGSRNYDYRYGYYPTPRYESHPNDCSVMTFRGHAVLKTLIRCHFSPAETTGSQYVYSGSSDGRIHIWSLDGRIVEVLDRAKTMPMSFDPSGPEYPSGGTPGGTCVRDVSWHTQEPVLMSAGWEGRHGGSSIARHEWKGMSKMQLAARDGISDYVARREEEATERRGTRRMPGSMMDDDDSE